MKTPLANALETNGMSGNALAEQIGTSRQNISRWAAGNVNLPKKWAMVIAPILGVSVDELLLGKRACPIVGYVAAGDAAFFDDGPYGDADAPDGATDKTVAVEVRGESLGPFFDHALVFYDDMHNPPHDGLIGKLCVVRLMSGETLLKKIKRGQMKGYYTLLSNVGPPRYDVALEWAAPVTAIRPR